MLFHTWPFAIFCLVVLPVFFALRRTSLWIPWLGLASYFFYGWWNPYYLILVIYSTLLDYTLVALMDHCPPNSTRAEPQKPAPVVEGHGDTSEIWVGRPANEDIKFGFN